MKTQVSMILYVNRTAVLCRGAFIRVWTGVGTAAPVRTPVLMSILYGIISPRAHFMPCLADRMSVFVKRDVGRSRLRCFGSAVDIDECIDIPMVQKPVSRDVVMGGIQADIFWEKPVCIVSKIIYSIEKVFTVMSLCGSKPEQQGKFGLELVIPGAEKIQSVSEIPVFVTAVPSPFCIRIGIMSVAVVPIRAGSAAGRKMFSIRRGMGDHGGSVTRYSKFPEVDESKINRGKDCKDEKNML